MTLAAKVEKILGLQYFTGKIFRLKDLLATGPRNIFFVLRGKILDSLELGAEDGIASA